MKDAIDFDTKGAGAGAGRPVAADSGYSRTPLGTSGFRGVEACRVFAGDGPDGDFGLGVLGAMTAWGRRRRYGLRPCARHDSSSEARAGSTLRTGALARVRLAGRGTRIRRSFRSLAASQGTLAKDGLGSPRDPGRTIHRCSHLSAGRRSAGGQRRCSAGLIP